MLFVYVDDILALSHHRAKNAIMEEITEFYMAKEGSVKPSEIVLGANISKMQLPDGREVWTTSPLAYIKNSLLVVERLFSEDGNGYIFKTKVKNPFPTNYKPELDVTEMNLNPNLLQATCS
jgi:hypothetical protein